MSKILGIGIATLDIINSVNSYPEENSEVRAISQKTVRGGNVTNSLSVLSQLNHQTAWAGTLGCKHDAGIILRDLEKHNINCRYVKTYADGKVPTSYILLNKSNGSRSIVHHRDLPELDFQHFKSIALEDFDWLHFEARNIEQTLLMLQHLKQHFPHIPCSIEFEKHRAGIETLYALADVLIFSKAFCLSSVQSEPEAFLKALSLRFSDKTLILAWGEHGAYAFSQETGMIDSPAYKPALIIDTLGAGDTFNAGIIDALLKGCHLQTALDKASRLAGYKISVDGFDISDYVR
ncbi:MAG: PfkB family carbohydrate kinase [Gammaproteobacteria bacterium]|nr:PfkB family carbohydrate kinase [Gammaproteobacteria bacterium]